MPMLTQHQTIPDWILTPRLASFQWKQFPTVQPGNTRLWIGRLARFRKGYTPFISGDILWAKITPCMQNGKSCIVGQT